MPCRCRKPRRAITNLPVAHPGWHGISGRATARIFPPRAGRRGVVAPRRAPSLAAWAHVDSADRHMPSRSLGASSKHALGELLQLGEVHCREHPSQPCYCHIHRLPLCPEH